MMSTILKDLSSTALVAAIEKNLQATWYLVGGTQHADVEYRDDLIQLLSGVPSPICNGVFRACFTSGNADREIEKALLPFQSRNLPMIWWTGPSSRPRDLGQRLEDHGLVHADDSPGMAVDLATVPERVTGPANLHIRSVATVRTLKHWLTAFETGFEMSGPEARFFFDVFASLGPEYRLPARHYVGFLDEKPVACSSMFLLAGVAGIYNVATVPEARGRGIGTAMVCAHLIRARAEGYRAAILHASKAGLGIYQRLGFRQYCEIGQYVWDGESRPKTTMSARQAVPGYFATPPSRHRFQGATMMSDR